MNTPIENVSPIEVGKRLQIAREAVKMKQGEVASAIDIARTTLIAIEQGQRRVKFGELQKLARLFGTTINALLRQEAVHVDLEPRFRRLSESTNSSTHEAVQLLANLAKAEVELENLLGVKRVRNYPPERPILRGDVRAQAEHDAAELRQRVGLGNSPIPDFITLLELELGVRVYVRRFNGKISGLFAFDEQLGPCMLLNANHPRDRRRQTAAHEVGHFVSTRREPEVLYEGEVENSREERYANAFGRALLTPTRTVLQKFHEITAGSDRLTRRHIIILAHFFGVSREAIARRLEELGLTKEGTWDWFLINGGITDDQTRQVLGDLAVPDLHKAEADRPTTLRLNLLAAEVFRQGLMSEGQIARLLHLDRVEVREMLDDQGSEGTDGDDIVNLAR
jgi:Zn-dependent peptidase ImmA (M78 family)/DNA-binding XRE family transcriptional regulator